MDSLSQEMDDLEKTHVQDVYNEIAPHFSDISHTAWPKVKQFIKSLDTGAFVADIGCGNGRYLRINKRVWKLGSDRCEGLVKIAGERGYDVMVADNLHLPYRDNLFDALISVAVIHHFSTVERRIQALKELCRIVRPGGRLLICVWAFEQKHRRFDGQDVLVPWTKPKQRTRHRSTSRLSRGTSSDVSSTSSISEDEVTQDSIVTEQTSVDTQTRFGTEDCVIVNSHCNPPATGQNGNGKSTQSCHHSNGNNPNGVIQSLSSRDISKSGEATPPVRPSSLRLLHRNTRYVPSHQPRYKQQTEKLQQYQSQVLPHYVSLAASKLSNHSLYRTVFNGQHRVAEQKISVKPFSVPPVQNRKTQAIPVLTKPIPNIGTHYTIPSDNNTTKQSIEDTTKQPIEDTMIEPPSILLKLKSLFTPKTKDGDQVKETKVKLSLLDYYKNCVKDLEEDLTSFKSFCKLLNSDNKKENLSREFIVRQFPESSQSFSNNAISEDRNGEGRGSAPDQTNLPTEDGKSQQSRTVAFVNQELDNPLQSMNGGLSCSSQCGQLCDTPCGKCLQLSTQHLQTSAEQLTSCAQYSAPKLSPCAQCIKCCSNHQLPCAKHSRVCDPLVQYPKPPGTDHGCQGKTTQLESQNGINQEVLRITEVNHRCDQTDLHQSKIKQETRAEVNCEKVFENFTSNISACLTNLSNTDVASSSHNMSLQRYYHVFKEGELEALICTHVPELTIIHSYFDHANWCLIAEKQSHINS